MQTSPQKWIEGIDISRYQKRPDFDLVRQAGAKFCYCKATEGETYVDPDYHRNAACALANGVWGGAYHFFRDDQDPEKQARHFAEVAEDCTTLIPVCDFEKIRTTPTEALVKVKWFLVVTEELWQTEPMLYGYPSFFDPYHETIQDYGLESYPLWIAHYTSKPAPWVPRPWRTYRMWQFDGNGGRGVGSVDCDWNRIADLSLIIRKAESVLQVAT